MTQHEYDARIASLNDEFRHRGFGGFVTVSERIKARGQVFVIIAKQAVQADDRFTPETDPRGRHDFGVVTVDGCRICWKIDYQRDDDPTLPVDPACPRRTLRQLSIFTPLEY
jgi:Protein of unknown function (DUF3768)